MRSVSLSALFATLLLWVSPLFAQFYQTDGYPLSVALADFDLDGYPDMAVVNSPYDGSSVGTVDVFFNDHKGGFGGYTSYAIPSNGTILALDLNGDGWPDLLISQGGGRISSVLINNGNGTFHTGTPPTTKASVGSFAAGDFNKDGKVDLAAVENVQNPLPNVHQIEILLNKGDGTFSSGQILALSDYSSNASVGDFDGDGNLDIANSVGSKALVWWGKGNGTFAAPLQIFPPTALGFDLTLTSADFNNDGLPDLALSSSYVPPCNDPDHPCPGTNTAYIYKNLGGRRFSLASSYIMDSSWAHGKLFTADLNGDLNQDLLDLVGLGGVFEGDLNYRAGNGAAGFGTLQQIFGSNAGEVDFRDLNLDSRQDMVLPDEEVGVVLGSSGYTNCKGASSASLNAKICAPLNNAAVNASFLVTAAGNSPIGVKSLEIWVDGKKVYLKLGDQLSKRITLSAGRHRLVVVAVDKYVGSSSTVEYVNVQ
jgi:hypothetical protein